VECLEELGRVALASEGGSLEGYVVQGAADLAAFTFLSVLFRATALKLRGWEEKPAVAVALRCYTREAIEEFVVALRAQEKIERGGGGE
jgi:hypothetical protein